jgi:type II secretory pathway component PulJ
MYFAEQVLPKKPLDKFNGFVLLEVLLAVSLILGSWMTMLGAYQNLTLRIAQEESKRAQLRKELDAFEISEHTRVNEVTTSKGLINESLRMPGRTRTQHGATKSSVKNKR